VRRSTLVLVVVVLGCGRASGPEEPTLALAGDVVGVHDPAILAHHGAYFVVSSSGQLRRSTDLRTWERLADVFAGEPGGYPPWVHARVAARARTSTPWAIEGGVWAPDVSVIGDRLHLYYSVSKGGSRDSCIGLATADRDVVPPRWRDDGEVVCSSTTGGGDWNAIDPNIAFDEHGAPWLAWGSFWSGIQLAPVDAATGKLQAGAVPHRIASRADHAIEAPFIVRRGPWFYLFVSFDYCCRGARSTYQVRVGRAAANTGPYVDREGVPMLDGGGTRVVESSARWRGPGHAAVLDTEAASYLVYHAYDADHGGRSALRIARLAWDEGWPRPTRPGAP